MFVFGMLCGTVFTFFLDWWYRQHEGKITIDRFWLANEDRWLSLRQILIEELEEKHNNL